MSEALTNEWQETCLQALCESAPDRRIALLEKQRNIVRAEPHKFGSLSIDLERAEVKRNGNPVSLSDLEFRLLRYLVERAGCLVSRDELLRAVWGYNRGALTRTVDMHIHSLRQKLEEDATRPVLIVTVNGAGYKFLARGNVSIEAILTSSRAA